MQLVDMEDYMHAAAKIAIAIVAALLGYAVGAFGGGFLVSVLSSNKHDKSIEAAMTGAFVIGPVVAIAAISITLLILRKQ